MITSMPSHSRLRVLNVSLLEDSGLYSCLASNPGGTAQHSVNITVTPFTGQYTYHYEIAMDASVYVSAFA